MSAFEFGGKLYPLLALTLLVAACGGGSSEDEGGASGDGDGGTGGAAGSGGSPAGGSSSGGAASGGSSSGGSLAVGGTAGSGGSATGGTSSGGTASGGATGDGGSDSGGTGGGGDVLDTFALSESGGIYTYTADGATMTIDPSFGGRITSFTWGGNETLAQSSGQVGSTFWTSPQEDWGWPPPPEFDENAYTVDQTDDTLTLTSSEATSLGIVVHKSFTPTNTGSGTPAVSVTYTIENVGDTTVNMAPWEISRVSSGMAFYPSGPAGLISVDDNLPINDLGAYTWYTYEPSGLSGVPKSFGDGADGWLAWSTGNAVAIKSFPDITQAQFAPNEAEIEIYGDPSSNAGDYMEVEQQGPVSAIDAGSSSMWTVVWTGAVIPNGADASEGSSDLIDLVTSTL